MRLDVNRQESAFMSESGKAVFLSYASQGAETARRIYETLRTASVEMWFEQSELSEVDASDRKIRSKSVRARSSLPSAGQRSGEEARCRRR